MSKHQEHILAVPAGVFSHESETLALIAQGISGADVIIAQRKMLEGNSSYRQLIPYTVLRCGDKIAAYRRTPKGGEDRLHGKISIGFGGHIDIADLVYDKQTSIINLEATIQEGAKREIAEELLLGEGTVIVNEHAMDKKIVSNLTPVDRVHAGLVTIVDINSEDVKAAEEQLNFIGFHTIEELFKLDPLEDWTKGLLKELANA